MTADILCDLAIVEEASAGTYAMWWPSTHDSEFASSPLRESIRRVYQAIDGLSLNVQSLLLLDIGAIKDITQAPQHLLSTRIPVQGTSPECVPFVLSFSEEKGIRLHFHRQRTSEQYRNEVWRGFAEYCEDLRAKLEEKQIKRGEVGTPMEWWALVEASAVAVEKTEGLKTLGALTIG